MEEDDLTTLGGVNAADMIGRPPPIKWEESVGILKVEALEG